MRTIHHSDHINGAGEAVYVSTVHYASAAERKAGDMACQRVVAPGAFTPKFVRQMDSLMGAWNEATPFGMAGEPQDPPEHPFPPNCIDGGEYRAALQFESATGDLNPDACKTGVCTTE